MSYILEALKKSDQQRQRGATPTLQTVQVTVAVPKHPMHFNYSLLAAVVLGAGIMIVWLHPWQHEQAPSQSTIPGTEPLAAELPLSISQQAAPEPLRSPPAVPMAGAMKPSIPALVSTGTPGAAPMPEKPARPANLAQEQEAIPLEALPLQIQQEIPAMTVQLHAYSNEPSERLVSVNSIRLREGESLMSGLRLEQITPDGMIFSYKGYHFQRGIR